MSDLLTILGALPGSYVEIGTVQSDSGSGNFVVTINGRNAVAKAAGGMGLVPGSQVVINRTSAGRFIIDRTDRFSGASKGEIIING